MGRIIDCTEMYEKFQYLLNQNYFVDKSNIINKFNDLINKDGSKNVCITKPRRFGKTSIAALLVTYYSKGINSKQIFNKLKVSRGIDYQELYDEIITNKKNEEENEEENEEVNEEENEEVNEEENEKENDKKNEKENDKKNDKKEEIIKKKVEKEIKKEKKQYRKFQGKYHTLYFDFSSGVKMYKTLNEYLGSINKVLKKDIKEVYPNSNVLNDYDNNIYKNLKELYLETKEKFVVIIDEWDYIIANNIFTDEEQDIYISFLRDLIKDRGYVAFVYMTGILPIAKELSQSTINCFDEFFMLDDKKYYQYFGLTEREVLKLCKNNKKRYEKLNNWYNGYKAFNGAKIFNPWSVTHALRNNDTNNYWTQTGRFDEIINIINYNINGVKDDILDLIRGKEISITLQKYGAEDLRKELKEKERNKKNKKQNSDKEKKILYSKMVTYGFLTYYDGKISIPNKELEQKFIEALSGDDDMEYYNTLIQISDEMLINTFNKNAEAVCKTLVKAHLGKIKSGDKMDHSNLKRVIDFAYFNARQTYDVDEEEGGERGDIDFIFYPRNKKKPLIILELKLDSSAKNTLEQIYEREYYYGLKDKGYKGTYLLIGLNLNKNRKLYSCIIDECNCDLKRISRNEYIPPKSEKRSKNDLESDGIFKRLRSNSKKLRNNSKQLRSNSKKKVLTLRIIQPKVNN